MTDAPTARRFEHLTIREFRVVSMLLGGLGHAQIARELKIADPTVKKYVSRLRSKLGLRDEPALREWAQGIVWVETRGEFGGFTGSPRTPGTPVSKERFESELRSEVSIGTPRQVVYAWIERHALTWTAADDVIYASTQGPKYDPLVETEWRVTFTLSHDTVGRIDFEEVPLGP